MSFRKKIILPYLVLIPIIATLGVFILTRQMDGILGVSNLIICAIVFIAVFCLVIAIGYAVAWSIVKPISSLTSTFETISSGDLSQRTGVKNNDEVGELAWTIDNMTEHMQQRIIELEKTNRVLEQMDRMNIRFIQVSAHELRTPLTSMMIYSGILEEQNNPEISKYARGMQYGLIRMRDIIDNLLDVSRIDSNLLKILLAEVEIEELIERTKQVFGDSLKEREISFKTNGLSNLPAIKADKEQLYKVFYNIIMNAIKYTPDGGTITVIGRMKKGDNGSDQVDVSIKDTGIGVDPQHQELIFEKFYQTGEVLMHSSGKTKFKGGGPGLGLAISRGIVDAHGGKIWMESPGHDEKNFPGSTVYIRLPVPVEQIHNEN